MKDLCENEIEKVKRTENGKGNDYICNDLTDFPNGRRIVLASNISYSENGSKDDLCSPYQTENQV